MRTNKQQDYRQNKIKREDRKMESNDSPEIADRRKAPGYQWLRAANFLPFKGVRASNPFKNLEGITVLRLRVATNTHN